MKSSISTTGKASSRLLWSLFFSFSLLSPLACTDDPDRIVPKQNTPPIQINETDPDLGNNDMSDLEDAGRDTTKDLSTEDTSTEDTSTTQDMPVVDPDQGTTDTSTGEDITIDVEVTQVRLDTLVPPRGPLDGGTPFVIEGAGFTDNTIVYFGGSVALVRLVDGQLIGETPRGVSPGPVDIKVFDTQFGTDSLSGGFTYTATLAIDSIFPARVPTDGNVEVTLQGRGFDEQTRVSFGGATGLRHTLVSPEQLRVITPPHASGPVDVRASNQDATYTLAEGVTYYETLRIDSIRPASGKTAGGDAVDVYGAGFAQGMKVDFGGTQATVQSIEPNGSKASVLTPPRPAGLTYVRVENTTGDAAIRNNAFFYSDATTVEVADVNPKTGPASGGVNVTLSGAMLDDPAIQVTFGGKPAMVVEQGPGHLVVQIPANNPGDVDIVVTSQNNTSTLQNGFTYVADLWIDRIMPDTSDVTGGIQVTIEGEGYTGAERVLFGGISAQFTIDSDTQIIATAPPHSAGVFDVVVERQGIKARLRDGFTYTEKLQVFGFSPVRGSVAGNTYVEVRGRGFIGDMTVFFADVPSPEVTILDSQTLAVRTPEGMPGAAEVKVIRNEMDEVIAPDPYNYFNPGARFGGAWGGPIQGAVNVTVYSFGGTPIENAFVMLSSRADTQYQGFTNANGMVTLSGPDVYGDQTITAVAANHSSATVQRVNAENITIFLLEYSPPSMGGPPPAGPSPATFTGTLTGLNKLAEPNANQFKMAIITTTQIDMYTPNPPPGAQNVILADGTYTLTSRLGDLAVIALGGLYDNSTQTFTPLAMGVERYLFASEGQQYQVDLDLNIPLDKTMRIKMNTVPQYPAGPNGTRAKAWMDFGFEGVFGDLKVADGPAGATTLNIDNIPALRGVLADVSYYVEGGAYTNGDNYPFSVGVRKNVTDLTQLVELPGLLDVPIITSPPANQNPVNGLINFTYNSSRLPDLFQVRVVIPMPGQLIPYWDAVLPGTATSVRLPDFPDFSNLPPDQRPTPYQNEVYPVLLFAVEKDGLEFNGFNYGDFAQGDWDAYSLTVHFIRL